MKTGLQWDDEFKHLPAKMGVAKDPACGGCPMYEAHATCGGGVRPEVAASDDEKQSLPDLQRWHWLLERRAIDTEQLLAATNFSWNQYNNNSDNPKAYVVGTTFEIDGVSGDSITLSRSDGGDPRDVRWTTFDYPNPEDGTGLTMIEGSEIRCAITPGHAILQFSDNSVLYGKNFPVVVGVTSSSSTSITLKLDKSCNEATTKINPAGAEINVVVWQYAVPPKWRYVIKPDYFYGKLSAYRCEASEVSTDGVLTLEASAAVLDVAFDHIGSAFVFEGQRIDNSAWETVPQASDRLFVLPNKAYVCFKTTKPAEGNASLTLTEDLTATYSRFRITYYKQVSQDSEGCAIVGYARCKHAIPVPGTAIAGYEGTGVNSVTYCAKRIYDGTDDPTDEVPDPNNFDDTVVPWQASATGISRFPASGLCMQKGCCSHYESAVNYYGSEAPFNNEKMVNQTIIELLAGTNQRRFQPQPGVDFWILERIQNTSLLYLAGYNNLDTDAGRHPQSNFYGNGAFAKPVVIDDYPTAGEKSIEVYWGAFKAFSTHDPTVLIDGPVSDAAGFKTTRDPLDQAATYDQDDLERFGLGVEKDEGSIVGYGVASTSMAVNAQNLIFLPNVDVTAIDILHEGELGTFQRHSTEDYATLSIVALRQPTKTIETIGGRTVKSVSSPATGQTQIEMNNVTHGWGLVSTVDPLVDDEWYWDAGGDPVTCPPPVNQEIRNYYEIGKSTGGQTRGVQRGDALGVMIDGTMRYYSVVSVTPHGGSAASDWGPQGYTPSNDFTADQDYLNYGKNRDVVVVLDPDGDLLTLAEGTSITFERNRIVMMPGSGVSWYDYGTNTLEAIPVLKCWYGEGIWHLDDTFFTEKTNGCFVATNLKWVDHRGLIPATAWNRIDEAIVSLDELQTYMGASGLGVFQLAATKTRLYSNNGTHSDTYDLNASYAGINSMGYGWTYDPLTPASREDISSVAFEGQALSIPLIMSFVPDGCTIQEAKLEVTITDCVREMDDYEWQETSPGVWEFVSTLDETDPFTTDFMVLAGSGPYTNISWSYLGSVSATANSDKQTVIDITDILSDMYALRDSQVHSFCLLPAVPAIMNGGSLADVLDDLMGGVSGRTNIDFNDNGVIDPNGTTLQDEENVLTSFGTHSVTYGDIFVDRLKLKFSYPETEGDRRLVIPRLPSMMDVIPAGFKRYYDGSTAPLE